MRKCERLSSFKKHSYRYKWLESLKDQPKYLLHKYDEEEVKIEKELCLMKLLDLYPRCNSPCDDVNKVILKLKKKLEVGEL